FGRCSLMEQIAVLEKVLQVREQEKTIAQKEKNDATALFEKRARELYDLLKKKEEAESLLRHYMDTYTSIDKIKEQSHFIQSIMQKVSFLQRDVYEAREKMNIKQTELTETHIETKKVEKLMEQKKQAIKEKLNRQENML